MSKIGKFVIAHKLFAIILSVLFFLMVAGVVLYCFSWVCLSPDSRTAHKLYWPSRQVHIAGCCSFISPAGWSVRTKDKYDPNDGNQKKRVSILGWLFEKADEFPSPMGPFIDFRFEKNTDGASFLRTDIVKFMEDMGVLPNRYKVAGKELLIWRYEGSKFLFPKNSPGYVAEVKKYKSISIAFCGKNFGFYGLFWGLPEHEKAFWDVMKSIQWKL